MAHRERRRVDRRRGRLAELRGEAPTARVVAAERDAARRTQLVVGLTPCRDFNGSGNARCVVSDVLTVLSQCDAT